MYEPLCPALSLHCSLFSIFFPFSLVYYTHSYPHFTPITLAPLYILSFPLFLLSLHPNITHFSPNTTHYHSSLYTPSSLISIVPITFPSPAASPSYDLTFPSHINFIFHRSRFLLSSRSYLLLHLFSPSSPMT